jgi:hypothetical protein
MFTNAAINATNIAKWNGTTWSALANGIGGRSNDFVASIAAKGTEVYVGGSFTNAGGILASNIARWDGAAWSPLGSGVAPGTVLNPPVVRALALQDGTLHVGGHFVSAGAKPSYGFAIWNPPGSAGPSVGLATLSGGNLVFSWNSISNLSYQILSTTNLSQPFTFFVGPILSTGGVTRHTNSTISDAARFFLIEQLPP